MAYNCKKCEFKAETRSEIVKHYRKEHPWSTGNKFTCRKCGAHFGSMSNLRKHQWKEHRGAYTNVHGGDRRSKAIIDTKDISLANDLVNGRASLKLSLKKDKLALSDLLEKLKSQRNFMIDVVNLIEGMMNQ